VLTRLLDALDVDEPATRASKARAFACTFALILLTEYWARAIPLWSQLATNYFVTLAAGSALCVAALTRRLRRIAFAGLAINHLALVWSEFPSAGNHAYLELYLCAALAFLRLGDEREQALLLGSVRWTICTVFFYSGLHKLAYGYYFHGQYLAYSMWIDTFRPVLASMMPAAEFARLAAFSGQPGDGPYLVASPLFVVVSNGVYVAELLLAPALLWPRTRGLAVAGGLLLMAAIEVAARELFFGMIAVSSLLLFVRSDLNRRMLWPFVLVCAVLLLARVGVLPAFKFY